MSRPSDDIRRITSDHSTIPSAARLVWPDAVPALFVRGIWPVDRPAIAIVGSTDPAPIAREWAFRLGQISADRGWVVVSGLARGIDAAAHEGALAGGGISVAVVANGLDSVYPAEHASLAKRMVERGGALISIAPTGEAATRERLLLRNQVTSALSNAVICVQARGRGGSLATMRHAVLQRRIIAACTMPEDAAEAEWAGNASCWAAPRRGETGPSTGAPRWRST
jgi:DNA processing protein